jgi:hypothetical protein
VIRLREKRPVAPTRNLFVHAVIRAAQVSTEDAEERVTQLRDRRSKWAVVGSAFLPVFLQRPMRDAR